MDDYKPGDLTKFLNPNADEVVISKPAKPQGGTYVFPKTDIVASASDSQKKKKKKKRKSSSDSDSDSDSDSNNESNDDEEEVEEEMQGGDVDESPKKRVDDRRRKRLEEDEMEEEKERKLHAKKSREEDPKSPQTVFVGNVPVSLSERVLKRYFKQFGSLDSVRCRSIAFEDSKLPRKAAFITKKFHPDRDTMNVYVVYKDVETAQQAVEKIHNQTLEGKHLRANMATEKAVDTESTVFVGNLPFDVTEEEVRTFFDSCGEIDYVRLIRDKGTNIGKGIGYVKFQTQDQMKAAIAMNKGMFKKREVRVFKAVPANKIKGKSSAARRGYLQRVGKSFEGQRSSKKKSHIRSSNSKSKGPKDNNNKKKKNKAKSNNKKVKMSK